MIEDLTRTEYETLLRQEFSRFAARCFYDLNRQTELAPNWHLEVIAAKLTVVREGKIQRLIINKPYVSDNIEYIFHPPMHKRAIAVCRRQQGGMKQRRSRAWADEEAGLPRSQLLRPLNRIVRALGGGTEGSNPACSSSEATNFRSSQDGGLLLLGCSSVPCASSSSGPPCGSQEEPPPVRPPRRRRVGPAQRASPLEPPPRFCEPPELQPRLLPRPLALRLRVLSPRV